MTIEELCTKSDRFAFCWACAVVNGGFGLGTGVTLMLKGPEVADGFDLTLLYIYTVLGMVGYYAADAIRQDIESLQK